MLGKPLDDRGSSCFQIRGHAMGLGTSFIPSPCAESFEPLSIFVWLSVDYNPPNTRQPNTASQKPCWMNGASVTALSVVKRCCKDDVRWDCVRSVQRLTYVPFLALRTFTIAGFCCATSCCIRLPLNMPFMHKCHLDSLLICNKRCKIALSALLPPGIYQPANSVSQTHSRDAQKPRWSFSVIWEAEKEIEWDLSLLSLFMHSPEVPSYLRSAPLCRPCWLLQFPFVFFLLCK